MKLHVHKFPLNCWVATLLGLHPTRPAEPKAAKRKPRPRRRHAVFLELP